MSREQPASDSPNAADSRTVSGTPAASASRTVSDSPTGSGFSYDALLLKNQLCFPLYACSREIIKRYKPFLDPLGLTYTQYITMMVLWERHTVTAKELGQRLLLDSGTLTPLLKKLEARGLLDRRRDPMDERNLLVSATEAGEALKEAAVRVPYQMAGCLPLSPEDGQELHRLLCRLLLAWENGVSQ